MTDIAAEIFPFNLEDAMRDEVKEQLDLSSLVSDVVDGYLSSYPDYAFHLQIETRPLWIAGSPDHLAQMLDKMIDNAVQFSPPGKGIVIRVRENEGNSEIAVLNEGPLIPDNIRERLFDPMVSYGKTNAKQSHLGLGLFVVRLISEYHHGSAWAENRKDTQGVVVTVAIPLINKSKM